MLRKQEKTREVAADQSQAPKRQKRLDEIPFSEAIGISLFEIWKEVKSDAAGPKTIDISKLEVEVRVGHIVAEFLRWKPQCSRKQICTLSGNITICAPFAQRYTLCMKSSGRIQYLLRCVSAAHVCAV